MNENELAGAPAPEQAPTAEPAAVTDNSTPEPTPAEAPKTFTQEELDAIVGKRLAREQRKWEREQAQKLKVTPPAPPPEPLKPDNFADAQAYADAMAERKAQELLAKREAEAEQAAMLEAYQDREEEARSKYDDFEQVAYNPKLPVTETMAQTIQASEMGPDVIYWLGSNPKEADRIARLSPLLQAREIGKIEARLGANPPAK
jgi:hypothetical protein